MRNRNRSHKGWITRIFDVTTVRLGHYRRTLFSTLLVGIFLWGCMTARTGMMALPGAAELAFERYDIALGSGESQTVLTGFLLDGTIAELVVVYIDENDDRRLRIYAFSGGTWQPRIDSTLSPEVLFVDVANVDGRDRLITYERGRVNWFDPKSGMERALVDVNSDLESPNKDETPHVDISRDVNDDGRDDLVVPDSDGFWVVIQRSDGLFADPVKLGPSIKLETIYEAYGYRYDPWGKGRIHKMDYDRDGRDDLVFWNEDHFEVHRQDQDGLFASAAETFTTDLSFDSDDLASLAAPQGVRRRRMDHNPPGDLTGRVLHSLTDLNDDGVADLGVFSLEGGSLWKMHFAYEVHFGEQTPDGRTVFAQDVGTVIRSDGIPFGMGQHDFDQDGQVEMIFTITKVGIFKAIGMLISALLTDSVTVDLELYRMEDGIYPDKPSVTRKIKTTSFGQSGERATVFPSVLFGDVNGDGRSDLLVQNRRKELRVYLGVSGPELFARLHHKVAVVMPNEEYTWLVDLDKNGKQDVLMHHPSTIEPHRVTVLMAQ